MTRTCAGILGSLTLLTSMARGVLHGGEAASVRWTAGCCLLVYSAIGLMVGWIAQRIVEQSVNDRVLAELAAWLQRRASDPARAETAPTGR